MPRRGFLRDGGGRSRPAVLAKALFAPCLNCRLWFPFKRWLEGPFGSGNCELILTILGRSC